MTITTTTEPDPEGVAAKGCDPFRVGMAWSAMTGALPPPIELVAGSDFVDFSNRL